MFKVAPQPFISELCPRLRPLIARVLQYECGCHMLDFFRQRPRAWLQAMDIAYYLHQRPTQTEATLEELVQEGILERFTVLDTFTFYGLSQSPKVLQALEQFWAWRDDWKAQVEQVRFALQLPTDALSGSVLV